MYVQKSEVREAETEEASMLNFLIRQCFADVARRFDLTPENCPAHPSNSTVEKVQKDLSRGVSFYYKVDMGIPCGCVGLEKAGEDLCYVMRLGVLPGRRGRGFGRELLEKAVTEARAAGAKVVSAAVIEDDLPLRRWYEKNGFVETETRVFDHLPFKVTILNLNL